MTVSFYTPNLRISKNLHAVAGYRVSLIVSRSSLLACNQGREFDPHRGQSFVLIVVSRNYVACFGHGLTAEWVKTVASRAILINGSEYDWIPDPPM